MTSRRTFLIAGGVAAVVAACSGARKRSSGASAAAGSPSTSPADTTGAAPLATAPATTAAVTGPATFVAHGPATSSGVALTFHTAGDASITQQILDQARRLDAKLTFFVVGTWAAANPGMLHAILDAGHELGNHTWSHINLPALPVTRMYDEIERCAAALLEETGSISRWFRPSQTEVPSTEILVQAGKAGYVTSVGYDVDPLDYTDPGAASVERRTAAKLHGGAIVSLHTLYQGTATAFPNLVSSIRSAGLEPVTTSTLLA